MNGVKIVKAIITTDGRTLIAQPDVTYRKEKRGTDWTALDAVTEAESEDMAELGIDPNWMDHATMVVPSTKERITVRLDRDVIA